MEESLPLPDVASPFDLRPIRPQDHAFVFNSALKSFRDAPSVRSIPNSIYFEYQHKILERILASPQSICIAACNIDDTDQIFGYVLSERLAGQRVIHWIYVKHDFRGNGIARALEVAALESLGQGPVFFTHRTKSVERLADARRYTYHPYLLMS